VSFQLNRDNKMICFIIFLEQLDSRVEHFCAMGFDSELAARAIRRSNGDMDMALTLLTAGLVPIEDDFDLLAVVPSKEVTNAPVALEHKVAPTEPDRFLEGVPSDAPFSAVMDVRVQQLIEMGFNGKDAEKALAVAKNDVNRALELLTQPVDDLSA
jgi:uncharacterized UBP type Zn finger protein